MRLIIVFCTIAICYEIKGDPMDTWVMITFAILAAFGDLLNYTKPRDNGRF